MIRIYDFFQKLVFLQLTKPILFQLFHTFVSRKFCRIEAYQINLKQINMNHNNFLTVVLALTIVSCGQKPQTGLPISEIELDPSKEIAVTGTKTPLMFGTISEQIILADTLLIVQDKQPEGLVHVFNINDMSRIASLCQEGRANYEFYFPYLYSQHYWKDGDLFIFFIDRYSFYREVNVSQSIREGRTVVSKTVDRYGPDNKFMAVFIDNDITRQMQYVDGGQTDFEGRGYRLFDSRNNESRRLDFLDGLKTAEGKDVSNFMSGEMYIHPDRNLVAITSSWMEYILFYDIDSGEAFARHIAGMPEYDGPAPDFRSVIFSTGGTITKDYIFTVHVTNDENGKEIGYRLLVLDWQGNLVKYIRLSEDVLRLAYDERTKTLFGISCELADDDDGYRMYRFDLSNILP